MPAIQLASPASGEKLYVGTTYNIQWTSSGATSQRVQYSMDGGVNFNAIQTGLGPNIQQLAWSIPGGIVPDGQPLVAAIVRVVVRDANGAEATSARNVIIANTEITSISPTRGPVAGNTLVNIFGKGFAPGCNVKFGNSDGLNTLVLGSTQIQASTPSGVAGPIDVKVKNTGVPGATLSNGFTYDPPVGPMISSINPSRGPVTGNTAVTIAGANFDPQVNVKFGEIDGVITQKSANQIVVNSPPALATGAVQLKVKNPTLPAVIGTFTYDPPALPPGPMISSVTPSRGPVTGNTAVTIAGANFDPQVNVKFGDLDGVITQKSATQIIVNSPPALAAGAVQLKVKNPNLPAVIGAFTYDPPALPAGPMISSVTPSRGPVTGNTPVTILGANFDPQVNVKFGDLDGVITQKSATQIIVNSPAALATGAVQLKVKNPTLPAVIGTFTYDPPAPPPVGSPRIDNITPPEGPATRSISVVITGANFVRDCNVRFGGVDARSVTFDNPGQLTVETPRDVPAGLVRVRVANPDQTSAARENGFNFNGPPTITRIDPPEGPREGGISVNVLGMNFKPGASVRFGDVLGTTLQVNPDGTSISCMLPPGQRGVVAVRVDNPAPDLQRGSLEAAFTYLGPQQEMAARIFSISPKTVLLETDTMITVKGRNLGMAIRQGVFAVRGPNQNFATIQMRDLDVSTSSAMQADTVTFFLKFSRIGGLALQQRVPYYIVASIRPEARNDRFFETSRNGQFTLITNSSPVAFGVTGQVIDGAANMILLSGRGLKGSKVAVVDSSGKSLPVNYVDDREDLLVVGLTLEGGMVPAGSTGAVSLAVLDASSKQIGSPISLDVMPGPPTNEDSDVPAGRLKPVPGQQVTTVPEASVGLFALASSGGGGVWLPGSPSFPASSFSYQPVLEIVRDFFIELVNESIVVPAFGRTSTKVGLLRRVRAVPLIIHLEITLVVNVRVFIFRQGNPFIGSSVGGFNEFASQFPDAFGTYLVFVSTSVSISIDVRFLIALLLPDDTLKPLLVLNVDFGLSLDKRTLTIPGSGTLRAHINSIRPRTGTNGLQLVAPAPSDSPLKDMATFFAFYFARAAGRECTEWEFNVDFFKNFLDGSPVEDGGDENNNFVVRICSEVAENANLNKLVLTSEPAALGNPPRLDLDTGAKRDAILRAVLVPVDKNGNPTGQGDEIKPPAVTFRFVPDFFDSADAITIMTDPGNQTRAMAQQSGTGKIQAALTTGPGMALLPSSVFGFLVTGDGAQAFSASLDVDVSAPSEKIKVRFDFKPILRPEPFEPAPDPTVLSLTLTDNIPQTLPANIELTIEREVVFFRDPMGQALKTGIITSGRFLERPNSMAPAETRIARFFTGDLVSKKTFKIKIPRDKFVRETPIPLPELSLLANRVEKRRPENTKFVYDALVPPGGFEVGPNPTDKAPDGEVGATQVRFNFRIKSETKDVEFEQAPVPAKLKVQRDENYEEYLRVLTECVEARGSSYDQELLQFANRLATNRSEQELIKEIETTADKMFQKAVQSVQNNTGDGSDRPLYWARLVARVLIKEALREKAKPNQVDLLKKADLLKKFEEHSRGIPMPAFAPTDRIKVAILGFDPFTLNSTPGGGNPAGLLALYLNGSTKLNLNQKDGAEIPVTVRSCLLPVRYADFDGTPTKSEGVVEEAIPSALIEKADLVLTVSKGDIGRYDIEQSACRFRATDKTDNLDIKDPKIEVPGDDQFRFTTLPWQGVIIRDDLTLPLGTGNTLQFNQYFKAIRSGVLIERNPGRLNSPPKTADAFIETPIDRDDPPLDPQDLSPQFDDTSISSSTGNFLSNESFYRVATLRDNAGRGMPPRKGKTTLPMGHFHLPDFPDTGDVSLRTLLFLGATTVIKQMLFDLKRDLLAKQVRPFMLNRVVKRTKRGEPLTIPITVDNRMERSGFEARVELAIATPVRANFEDPFTPDVTIGGKQETLVNTVKFLGGERGVYSLACTVRETENRVPVFRTDVIIKVADPKISSVQPLMGNENTSVKITGQDFVPRTGEDKVDVKFGGVSAKMVTISADAKTITCRVPKLAPGMADVELISPHDPKPIKFTTQFMVTA
ncbi:MAG TPA: IPT/TIG domain-containing protein [Pyrinomonadaceae bacterium]|nr:IPT/TIG domain-containing protein [Pyrinomonadaceae bacterium]